MLILQLGKLVAGRCGRSLGRARSATRVRPGPLGGRLKRLGRGFEHFNVAPGDRFERPTRERAGHRFAELRLIEARSEEHTHELHSLMHKSYAFLSLQNKK